jgi:hypothetical protein
VTLKKSSSRLRDLEKQGFLSGTLVTLKNWVPLKTDDAEGFPLAFPLNYFPPQSGSVEIQGAAGDPAFPLNTGFPLNGGPVPFIYANS